MFSLFFLHFELRMDAHANSVPVQGAKAMKIGELEEDTWKLVKNRLEYDWQAIRVYRIRLTSFEGTLYQQKLAHRMKAWENSHGAAGGTGMSRSCAPRSPMRT